MFCFVIKMPQLPHDTTDVMSWTIAAMSLGSVLAVVTLSMKPLNFSNLSTSQDVL